MADGAAAPAQQQKPLKGWQSAAHSELAKYYAVLAERDAFEQRLADAKAACERAGVTFRFGSPQVDTGEDAYRCPCGAVVVNDYYARQGGLRVGDGVTVHCAPCREKSAEAAKQDAALEGTPLPKQKPGSGEEVPF